MLVCCSSQAREGKGGEGRGGREGKGGEGREAEGGEGKEGREGALDLCASSF